MTQVELVDETGTTIGVAEKLAAHQAPGHLHRAFSVFLLDSDGRLVLQRRAAAKYHSGGLWSNTCCGHPGPGEAPAAAARRRVTEELGVDPGQLRPAGTVLYRVVDSVSGLREHEWNHLFVGMCPARLDPDPDEVSATRSVELSDVDDGAGGDLPRAVAAGFTAWFPSVYQAARPALISLRDGIRTAS
jgi:isopentenyl-diphosphate delta-isomerase